jgi:hypothetical protein
LHGRSEHLPVEIASLDDPDGNVALKSDLVPTDRRCHHWTALAAATPPTISANDAEVATRARAHRAWPIVGSRMSASLAASPSLSHGTALHSDGEVVAATRNICLGFAVSATSPAWRPWMGRVGGIVVLSLGVIRTLDRGGYGTEHAIGRDG